MNKKTPQEKEVIQKAVEPQNALQQDTVPLNLPEDAQQGAPMVLQAPKGGGKMGRLNQLIDVSGWEEGEFMDDVRQATLRGAHPLSKILFWGLGVCLLLLYLWATFAQVEEVTRGEGKVIPSGQVRKIQHQEGGMVQEILARQGQVVDRGEPLIVLDDTGFAATFGEKESQRLTLMAEVTRLQAEAAETPTAPEFPQELAEKAPYLVDNEMALYLTRQAELNSSLGILEQQMHQKEQELEELKSRAAQADRSYKLAAKELAMTQPLAEDGVVSQVEMLRLEREVNNLLGERDATELAAQRARTAVEEAQQKVAERKVQFRSEVLRELAEKRQTLKALSELLRASSDQVDRAIIRAPENGVIKQVFVNTIGEVVKPGDDLVELVPIEDTLLVEARIRPQDIAFIAPGQRTMVKFSAYDFTIYGGLEGEVEQIGVDTVVDEQGNPFYPIRVRTHKSNLGDEHHKLDIKPGMVATIDIVTGKRTIMDYLLKPLRRTKERALRER